MERSQGPSAFPGEEQGAIPVLMGKTGWYVVLVVVFGVIPGWVLYKTSAVMSAYRIDATEPFAGGAIPAGYERLNSIAGSGGKLFEYYNPSEHTKFSLLVSPIDQNIAALPDSPDGVLKALVARQNAGFVDQPSLAHFTQGYLGSAIDPQRAYDVSDLPGNVRAIRFITNKGANYVLSAWRSKVGDVSVEVALLAMKKNEPVSATALDNFVKTLNSNLASPA